MHRIEKRLIQLLLWIFIIGFVVVCIQDGNPLTNSLSVRDRVASSEDVSQPFWTDLRWLRWFVSVEWSCLSRLFDCCFMSKCSNVGTSLPLQGHLHPLTITLKVYNFFGRGGSFYDYWGYCLSCDRILFMLFKVSICLFWCDKYEWIEDGWVCPYLTQFAMGGVLTLEGVWDWGSCVLFPVHNSPTMQYRCPPPLCTALSHCPTRLWANFSSPNYLIFDWFCIQLIAMVVLTINVGICLFMSWLWTVDARSTQWT